MIRTLVVLLLGTATLPVSSVTAEPPSRAMFRFADPRITEASGITAGLVSRGVFYVQNDSGDRNRFFAIDARTGTTAATVIVPGARNVDWEDIAVAPDRAGAASVWIADIGDNDAARPTVRLYRVREPKIDSSWDDHLVRIPVQRVWRLRYPGGPVDAESLAVSPSGTAYIVTKTLGRATVYRVPGWRPGVQALRRVGRITFHPTGTADPFGSAGQLMATGAAISPDGVLFAVRTYSDAWVWRLGERSMARALRTDPAVVSLPRDRQGEGVAFVGGGLVIDSEGMHSVATAVPLPHRVRAATRPGVASTAPRAPTAAHASGSNAGVFWIVGGVGVALATLALGVGLATRRWR